MKKTPLLAASIALLAACNQDARAGSTSAAADRGTPATAVAEPEMASAIAAATDKVEGAASVVVSAVEKFRASAKPSLESVDRRVADLERKGSTASASAKAELEKVVTELRERRKALGLRIFELKKAAPARMEAGLEELRDSLADLQKAADDASARFR